MQGADVERLLEVACVATLPGSSFGREPEELTLRLALVGNVVYYLFLASAIQRAGGPLPTMIIGTLPVVIAVAGNALIPLMTVVNYSVQFVRGNRSAFRGFANYQKVLGLDPVVFAPEAAPAVLLALLLLQGLAAAVFVGISARLGRGGLLGGATVLAGGLATSFLALEALQGGHGWAWHVAAGAALLPLGAVAAWLFGRLGLKLALAAAAVTTALLPFMLNWPFIHQAAFSLLALLIQIPLGVGIALLLPRRGLASSLILVAIAVPLLIPLAVIGFTWRVYTDPGIGLLGQALRGLGIAYDPVQDWWSSWSTILLMDAWHWTGLVALLAVAGLRAIPPAWYQAAQIDGASRWAVFRHVELPRLRSVLVIAVLLRFMDSFMVFTEPHLLNSGGPGSATEMLSTRLFLMGDKDPTSGPAAAFSLVYLLVVLLGSYVLYTAMMRAGRGGEQKA